jgi:endonuclease/exonuclease/phosphatase family metal-dependent hydrolase
LSTTEDIVLDMHRSMVMDWFLRLKPLAHKLLRLPGLRSLLPMARQVASAAEPAGRLSLRAEPARTVMHHGDAINVLSANLCHDWPRFRQLSERLEAVAQLIEQQEVDIALLQEVVRTPQLQADSWLADRLGMAYVYSRANGNEKTLGFEEGLAVFSRFPLSSPALAQLRPGLPFTRRLGLGAEVATSLGPVQVFSVHLATIPAQNSSQSKYLRRWIGSLASQHPVLIGGDFNATEKSRQIGRLQKLWVDTFRHLHPQADGTTHEIRWPWGAAWRRRLDYLFLRPGNRSWRVLNTRHLDAPGGPHSDHRAVLATLAFDE